MKIRPVGAELLHADERTDRHDEAHSRFSQFCERAQKFSSPSYTEYKPCRLQKPVVYYWLDKFVLCVLKDSQTTQTHTHTHTQCIKTGRFTRLVTCWLGTAF